MTSTANQIHHAKEAAQRERSLRTLAENAKWLDEHRDRTVHATESQQPDPTGQVPKVKAVPDTGQSRR